MIKHILTKVTHNMHTLPVLVLMPHSRCNCRCVMCDIWKANAQKKELSVEDIQNHVSAFRKLGVKRVALSGGEALLHSNLWLLCDALKGIGARISLLSTGVTLKNHVTEIVSRCDDVIVSLDGSPSVHNQIRNIPHAFEKLAEGVRAIKNLNPQYKITGRCVIQKSNFHDFENILTTAIDLGLNQISFLPADVSSSAFNRSEPWGNEKTMQVALSLDEAEKLEALIKHSFIKYTPLYARGFINEGQEKMLSIPQYYKAIIGHATFPGQKCNAPWVSAVIESNGDVMPCFFHKPYGNIYESGFEEIINSKKSVQFRKQLDVKTNATCTKCVCSLYVSPFQTV